MGLFDAISNMLGKGSSDERAERRSLLMSELQMEERNYRKKYFGVCERPDRTICR